MPTLNTHIKMKFDLFVSHYGYMGGIFQLAIQQSELLLPWYANGTLPVAQRQSLQADFVEYSELGLEADWLVCVVRQMKGTVSQAYPSVGHTDGRFQRVLERINNQRNNDVL
jgi:hypothetical protein